MTTNEYITLAGIILGMLGTGISLWVGMKIRIAELSVEVKNLQKNHAEFNETVREIFEQLKEIHNRVSEKADRK